MSRKFYIIIFLSLIFLGLGGFIAIRLGFFPVVVVNNRPVGEAYFNGAVEEIIDGFSTDKKIPGNLELKRLALQKVIENELIYSETKKYFGSNLSGNEKPEALRALLHDQVSILGSSFEDWFKQAKKGASVYILVSGFTWSGDEVVLEK